MISRAVAELDGGGGAAAASPKEQAALKAQIQAAFTLFDVDGSGDIDGEELGAVASELGMEMSAAEVMTPPFPLIV